MMATQKTPNLPRLPVSGGGYEVNGLHKADPMPFLEVNVLLLNAMNWFGEFIHLISERERRRDQKRLELYLRL